MVDPVVTLTSQFRASAMLLLRGVGN